MKRAKVMLMAIAVFATVGAALAFKAQKFGITKYCYTITDSPPPAFNCTSTASLAIMKEQGQLDIFYTTTTLATPAACALLQSCPNFAKTIEQ